MRRWRPMGRPPTATFAARASGPGQAAAALASWTIGSRVSPERMTQCELRRRRTRDLEPALECLLFYHRNLNPDPDAPLRPETPADKHDVQLPARRLHTTYKHAYKSHKVFGPFALGPWRQGRRRYPRDKIFSRLRCNRSHNLQHHMYHQYIY